MRTNPKHEVTMRPNFADKGVIKSPPAGKRNQTDHCYGESPTEIVAKIGDFRKYNLSQNRRICM